MRCPFCGRESPLTREHIFAIWLRRRFGTSARVRPTALVCAACNTGWMSTLETSFRSAFERRRERPLAAPDRTTMARWVTKTAVLLAREADQPLADDPAPLRSGMPDGVEVYLARRRPTAPALDHLIADGSVAVVVDDMVARVARAGVLGRAHGTRLWPPRTHVLRWDTLPMLAG